MRSKALFGAGLVFWMCACGSDDGGGGSNTPIAVLSAFPAELAAVLEHVTVESNLTIADRNFRIGTVGGAPVIVGMTGIGLVNAANVTHALLEQVEVSGVVVSGVAGSSLRIGDVAVPGEWELADDGGTFASDPSWLEIAANVAQTALSFEQCTQRPTGGEVCLLHQPEVVVGGIGESDDPYNGTVFACQPNGGDVLGCDVTPAGVGAAAASGSGAGGIEIASVDMETAAIAREAAAVGVPFIAFRAVSDGAGDPLGLPGFPAQFFTYYRLAAHNAAAAAAAFVAAAGN